MSTLRLWLSRVLSAVGRDQTSRLDEELQLHIEELTADYMQRGMPEEDARSAALRDFGNVMSMREEYREQKRFPLAENLWRDVRFSARALRRSPAYALSCIATWPSGLAR